MKSAEKLTDLAIYNVHPFPVSSVCPHGGIGCEWSAPQLGFGLFAIWGGDDGRVHVDTENMDSNAPDNREFTKAIFALLAREVVIDN